MTYVSSLISDSSDLCSARSAEAAGVSLVMREFEDDTSLAEEGKLILETTDGHRSLMRGRKLVSFCERMGKICMTVESRERRRYGEGEDR